MGEKGEDGDRGSRVISSDTMAVSTGICKEGDNGTIKTEVKGSCNHIERGSNG